MAPHGLTSILFPRWLFAVLAIGGLLASGIFIGIMSIEGFTGTRLVNLPIQVNVNHVVPKVFRLPIQAVVTAASAVVRVFCLKIIFGLEEDES